MVASTLKPGDTGPLVLDLRSRLLRLGFSSGEGVDRFDGGLEDAIRIFQQHKGLQVDGICGKETWRALDDATFDLGDRLLCATSPMMRGDDVSALQIKLGTLGFDAGRIDGFFGPDTQAALGEFQQNAGVVCDQVCGPETIEALNRMASRGSTSTVSGLRERERLRGKTFDSADLKVALCHPESSDPVIGSLGSELSRAGAEVAIFSHSDWSVLAQQTNAFGATICIAIDIVAEPTCEISYYVTEGFTSFVGERLAKAIRKEIPKSPSRSEPNVSGKRLAILRETKAPAVFVRLGSDTSVSEDDYLIAAGIHRAIIRSLESQDA